MSLEQLLKLNLKTIITDIHSKTVQKAQSGNKKAIRELYQAYAKAMFNICYRMTNNIADAEDILQEAFCEAFSNINNFRFESTFGAWLKRIVVNRCINELKKKKLEFVYSNEDNNYETNDNDNDDDILFQIEKIKNAMHLLPEGYRVIFSLYLIEGYDHSEISNILGISESTSKSQFARAKKKLIQIIKTSMN